MVAQRGEVGHPAWGRRAGLWDECPCHPARAQRVSGSTLLSPNYPPTSDSRSRRSLRSRGMTMLLATDACRLPVVGLRAVLAEEMLVSKSVRDRLGRSVQRH